MMLREIKEVGLGYRVLRVFEVFLELDRKMYREKNIISTFFKFPGKKP